MSKAKLKKYLLSLPKEETAKILLELYDASKEAKAWLEFYLEPKSDALLEKYKKAIYSQFYGRNYAPKYPSFSECNKLITAFKKLVPDPPAIADLMLYYVEQGCSLTAMFGDYGQPFYTALENNFRKAVQFADENGLIPELAPRMTKMIESVQCCGYGFPDILWDIYYVNGGE